MDSLLHEDDRVLNSIVQTDSDKHTEKLLKCLQRALETQRPPLPLARVAGANGLRMTRAAFALLIKFSDMLEDLISLTDQIQFFCEYEAEKAANLDNIITFLKELPSFQSILKKWQQASRMRQWISDQKQILSTKFEAVVKEEMTKRNQEPEQENEGQIDSSSQPVKE